MKLLWVGDVHATVRELADCEVLLDLVEKTAREQQVDEVLFAGDLYDNFSLVNTIVMEFWKRRLAALKKITSVKALKGNHDMSNDSTSASHALMAHDKEIFVIDTPTYCGLDEVAWVPFIRDPLEFAKVVGQWPQCKLLFCHQDFSGAQYENGFYSKEGVDPAVLPPQLKVVSGHIHAPYEFGNVWYPGAPRWRTLTDARVGSRFLYVFDIEDGEIVSTKEIRTGQVCRKIKEILVTPDGPNELECCEVEANTDYRISITGPEDFVREREMVALARFPSSKIASVIFDEAVKLRESDGISASFRKWFDAFNPPFGTSKDVLNAMVKDRIVV